MKLYLIWTDREQKNPWRVVAVNIACALKAWREHGALGPEDEPDRIELKDSEVIFYLEPPQ